MTEEGPRRRASDQRSISSLRSPKPASAPEPAKTETSREAAEALPRDASFYQGENGRAYGSRERRQRDLGWNGPERRISGRF
jgi:hypothetical protein